MFVIINLFLQLFLVYAQQNTPKAWNFCSIFQNSHETAGYIYHYSGHRVKSQSCCVPEDVLLIDLIVTVLVLLS